MNKVTLLAIIALTMLGSLIFKAWQRTPVVATPQPKAVAVASASVDNEEFRARLRKIIARAKAASQVKHVSSEHPEIHNGGQEMQSEKSSAKP